MFFLKGKSILKVLFLFIIYSLILLYLVSAVIVSLAQNDMLLVFFFLLMIVGTLAMEVYYIVKALKEGNSPNGKVSDDEIINELIKPLLPKRSREDRSNGVEGFIGSREFNMKDIDNDGKIAVHEYYPLTEEEVNSLVVKEDPNFSKVDFYEWAKRVMILFQESWVNKDLTFLRRIEADALFHEHSLVFEKNIKNRITTVIEDMKIKGCLLKDYYITGNKQVIVVAITVKMIKYKIDESGRVIEGSRRVAEDYPYILQFSRNVGVTSSSKTLSTSNCPNCGAVIKIGDKGECTYCGSSLISGEYDWVLININTLNFEKFGPVELF